ncbi:hypothetical protein IFM89_007419 [Coptis chinensis]|uniref:Cystatin domain-containing protein n=1 Tax=Coptis chinensis TaxID=261450 RepID=A0A835IUR3_9MAGN|nr:hypothetical protein IFM89_007419 [Coptis chinensis]
MTTKSLLLPILLLSLIFFQVSTGSFGVSRMGRVGGWTPIKDIKDPEVQDIGKFAVTEHNKEEKTELRFVQVVRGESQVVAGFNYRLILAAVDGSVTTNYQANLQFIIAYLRVKKAREEEDSKGRCSTRSDDADLTYPFDTYSLDDSEEGELEDSKDESNFRKSFSYGTLAHANFVGGSYYSDMRINGGSEDLIYYSHHKSDVGSLPVEYSTTSVTKQSLL